MWVEIKEIKPTLKTLLFAFVDAKGQIVRMKIR
jgi:hypothetical protein